jgi:glycosyltransferase involved in cell wall biosynthesis
MPLVYTLHHERVESLSNLYADHPDVWYIAISKDQMRREIPLPNCRVVHHALDAGRYSACAQPADYAVFLGRLAGVKGVHTAIDAAAAAGVPIRVAGDVHEEDREFGRRELAHRLAQPHVTCVGRVGREGKRALLRDARALLAPVDWNEPFGLAYVEAMLSGCPVLAFPRGSIPELIEQGVTGYIVADVNEMAKFLRPGGPIDSFDRSRCRARAIERFHRDVMVEQHEALYRAILEPNAWRMRTAHVASGGRAARRVTRVSGQWPS